MKISSTNKSNGEVTIRVTVSFLVVLFLVLSPVLQVFAQEVSSDVSTTTITTDDPNSPSVEPTTASTSEVIITDTVPETNIPIDSNEDVITDDNVLIPEQVAEPVLSNTEEDSPEINQEVERGKWG